MFPTILIVDDEPSIVQSLGGLLTDEGFEITTASNGYEALQQIEANAPDLILLDIWMPGIDGLETLQEIKKNHPHTQVIMITGHGTIETAVQSTKLGAFDFIESDDSSRLGLRTCGGLFAQTESKGYGASARGHSIGSRVLEK